MTTLVHQPICARLRHWPARVVRCSCGADPLDAAPPERCPACDCALAALTSWSTPAIAGGHAVNVVTCSAEACRAQVGQLARHEVARGAGVRLVNVTEQLTAMPVDLQTSLYGYAVTERAVEPADA